MRQPAAHYLLSLAAIAAAILLRQALDPLLGDALPYITIFAGVAAAMWFAGTRAAIVAALICYVAANYLFIAPRGELSLGRLSDLVGLAAYAFTCAIIIAFGEAMRRAQRRASERGELLQVTLRSIGDAVVTTDLAARITYLNAVAEELTGWTSAEAVGQPLDTVFNIVNEATRRPVENPARRALREGVVVGLANHTILIRKDGSERPIDDSAAPIRDDDGRVSGCVLVFRDVSRQRDAEQERARQLMTARLLAAIVESSDDAIISKSLDGIIQSWNAGAERLFGYAAADAIGRHISLVIPPDRIAEEDFIIARQRRGERIEHFETERIRRDGERIFVSLTVSPIRDAEGKVVGASKIAHDITARKRMENDLRQLAAELAEAGKRKDEFMATLAHELRNPLAPLINMLEVMKRANGDQSVLERAQATMERQLRQMVRLVDDLLDLNRITHARLELRKTDVEFSAVIAQAVEASRPLIDAAGHELVVSLPSEPIWLNADPARLAQVFGNLLNNACKYTKPGGRIEVGARIEDDDVCVSVKDNGTGIPPDKLEAIFEMFAQVDRPLERAQGGLGIGLTLVKRLLQVQGGSITARSAGENHGSEFVVRLPVVPRPVPAAAPAGAKAALHGRRILIADDNCDAAESLAMLLTISGNETYVANDGIEALAAAERHRPDVVLLDIGMPKLDGLEVCRRIREQPWGRDIAMIALTGWGQDEDRQHSREAGFDGHLVKPVDHDALLALLAALPEAREATHAAT